MRRVPDGEKWDIKMLEELKAVPWAEEGEAEETEGVPAWLEEDAAGNEENEQEKEPEELVKRQNVCHKRYHKEVRGDQRLPPVPFRKRSSYGAVPR